MNRLFLIVGAMMLAGSASAQDAKNGKVLYTTKYRCYSCHGYSGQNGPGARLVPMKMTQEAFTAHVRNPITMQPYTAKVMSDAELADVYAYIKTLPDSPAAKSIPLLSDILSKN